MWYEALPRAWIHSQRWGGEFPSFANRHPVEESKVSPTPLKKRKLEGACMVNGAIFGHNLAFKM